MDGAIHRADGRRWLEECRVLNGFEAPRPQTDEAFWQNLNKIGEAKILKGDNLHTNWILHTVRPIWQDGNHDEDELLVAHPTSIM